MKSCVVIPRKHKLNLLFKKMPRSLTHIFLHGRKKKSLFTSPHTNTGSKQIQNVLLLEYLYQFPHAVRINNNSVCYHYRECINTCKHNTVCTISQKNYRGFPSSVSYLGLRIGFCFSSVMAACKEIEHEAGRRSLQ